MKKSKLMLKAIVIILLVIIYTYIVYFQSIPDNIVIFEGESVNLKTMLGLKADLTEKDEVIEAINEIADSSDIVERVRARVGDSAKDILQKFLKVNKKHVSEKYHALVDSIPNNAYSLAKNDILDDVRKNLVIKNQVQNTHKTSGWQLHNGEIMGYKF